MTRTLAVVGAGRVGRELCARLRESGWTIGAVVTRHRATAKAAVRAIGGGVPYAALTRSILASGVVLLATPDDVLGSVAKELARIGGEEWRGKVALHSSGALAAEVLAPLARSGAHTASMHPMQTFSARGRAHLEGVVFTLEGHPGAVRVARAMARSLGGVPVRIEAEHKPLYHCAGGFAATFPLAMMEAGTRLLKHAGIPRRQALGALLSLCRQTLENLQTFGPRAAWTGPLSRNDFATIRKHVEALRHFPPEYAQAYCALTRLAARILADSPRATLARVDGVLKAG